MGLGRMPELWNNGQELETYNKFKINLTTVPPPEYISSEGEFILFDNICYTERSC